MHTQTNTSLNVWCFNNKTLHKWICRRESHIFILGYLFVFALHSFVVVHTAHIGKRWHRQNRSRKHFTLRFIFIFVYTTQLERVSIRRKDHINWVINGLNRPVRLLLDRFGDNNSRFGFLYFLCIMYNSVSFDPVFWIVLCSKVYNGIVWCLNWDDEWWIEKLKNKMDRKIIVSISSFETCTLHAERTLF